VLLADISSLPPAKGLTALYIFDIIYILYILVSTHVLFSYARFEAFAFQANSFERSIRHCGYDSLGKDLTAVVHSKGGWSNMLTSSGKGKIYRIGQLAKELDRHAITVKRWEEEGLIPKARRDSRGWRYYTEAEVREIKRIVEERNYFVRNDISAVPAESG
jgi:hypothetical protein